MFEVEKDVNIPDENVGANGKYPFGALEIGDSFFVPADSLPPTGPSTVSNCAVNYAARHNKKFTTRKIDGGVRVWRIE